MVHISFPVCAIQFLQDLPLPITIKLFYVTVKKNSLNTYCGGAHSYTNKLLLKLQKDISFFKLYWIL